jgi:hypothetical protein
MGIPHASPPVTQQIRPTLTELGRSPIVGWKKEYQSAPDQINQAPRDLDLTVLTISSYQPAEELVGSQGAKIKHTRAGIEAVLAHIDKFVSKLEIADSHTHYGSMRLGPSTDVPNIMPAVDISTNENLVRSLDKIESEANKISNSAAGRRAKDDRDAILKADA